MSLPALAFNWTEIFAPTSQSALEPIFEQYARDRVALVEMSEVLRRADLLGYFVVNAGGLTPGYVGVDKIATLEPALRALDAAYWQRALDLTDVLDSLPQARREQWNSDIDKLQVPPFEPVSVARTLRELLDSRAHYFAERVDGLFRALSKEHLTNRPEGFGKRMIVWNLYGSLGVCSDRAGYLHDLRCVMSKLLGREAPMRHSSYEAIAYAREVRCGEWVSLDAGALRIRCYKVGTSHMEIHPEIAWKLNAILAYLHPRAIPAPHRERPKTKPSRDFVLFDRPLPVPVLRALDHLWHVSRHSKTFEVCAAFHSDDASKAVRAGVYQVLEALGGVREGFVWRFPYHPSAALREVVMSGALPDEQAYQYYPTPRDLAAEIVAIAEIGEGHRVLEPSAGQGAIARLLPASAVLVEVSGLHCEILRAQGRSPIEADFLAWRPAPGDLFDRVAMNPPFSEGRARLHLEHAASMVAPGGRLVAVLPASQVGRGLGEGWSCTWSEPRAFEGVSIQVCILTADRA
jgi:hypothetical protein